ncbi:MAG TPA: flagellar motor protein MotB, partial [bacterium]|nr:flagellar motor protein MotB [bacterium]
MSRLLGLFLVLGLATSCVTSGTHQLVVDELAAQKRANEELTTANEALKKEIADLQAQVAKLKKEFDEMSKNFMDAMTFNDDLKKKLKEKGASIEELDAQNKELAAKKEEEAKRAAEEQAKLESEKQALKAELEQLRRMKEAAEKRNAEFNNVMAKLKKMIDAGTLSVKIRKGRMIVTLSSDILFAVGATELTPEGKAAIEELAATLKDIPDRNFLVVGHSDSTPIKKKFASNWELSSQRAIEVVKLMIASGVPPVMISASGNAEFDPIAENDTPENKTLNRRVEIVLMP